MMAFLDRLPEFDREGKWGLRIAWGALALSVLFVGWLIVLSLEQRSQGQTIQRQADSTAVQSYLQCKRTVQFAPEAIPFYLAFEKRPGLDAILDRIGLLRHDLPPELQFHGLSREAVDFYRTSIPGTCPKPVAALRRAADG